MAEEKHWFFVAEEIVHLEQAKKGEEGKPIFLIKITVGHLLDYKVFYRWHPILGWKSKKGK